MRVDLHVHTRASDGFLSPGDVVRQARRQNVGTLAITDHDSVAGVPAATRAGQRLGVKVVPGVELGCEWGSREVHILGLWINTRNWRMLAALRQLKEARVKRVRKIVERLQGMGLNVSCSRVRNLAAGGVPGRVHVARALVEQQVTLSVDEAFRRFLATGRPGYVPRHRLQPRHALEMVRMAGGLSVLAHPGSMEDECLWTWRGWGLAGIEVFTPHHSAAQARRWLRFSRSYGFLPTGGSDYHGLPGEGGALGSYYTPKGCWQGLGRARAKT